jgi:2-dehydro-3-deoxy-D-gluconate 5-dehydrogenase
MNIIPKDKLINLDNKVAIVTGSTVGIGYGIAYRLGEAGAKVILTGRDTEEGKIAEDELTAKGFKVKFVKSDVSIEEEVKMLISESLKIFGRIDILVNNAGIFPFLPLAQMTTADFEKVINTNLKGVFMMIKYVSTEMIKKGEGGKIINITSIDALHPSMMGLAHYDASKHGVWGFTKNVALELAKDNIWVNAIAPGGVMTKGVAVAQAQGKTVTLDRNPEPPKMEVAMGRMGVPDDIGKVALFLASDMSSYMTGSQIVVDGGYLLK